MQREACWPRTMECLCGKCGAELAATWPIAREICADAIGGGTAPYTPANADGGSLLSSFVVVLTEVASECSIECSIERSIKHSAV